MAGMKRVVVEWYNTGVIGGGVSTHYFRPEDEGVTAALHTFFDTVKVVFPNKVQWSIPSSGDVIDDATGDYLEGWEEIPQNTVLGTLTGHFALGVGARIVWETAGRTNNRRVRGSTFMVPLISDAFDTDGTLTSDTMAVLSSAAEALRQPANPRLLIWTRPSGAVAGSSNSVIASRIPDHVSWLRSRRE